MSNEINCHVLVPDYAEAFVRDINDRNIVRSPAQEPYDGR